MKHIYLHALCSTLILCLITGCATDAGLKNASSEEKPSRKSLVIEPSLSTRLAARDANAHFNADQMSLREAPSAKPTRQTRRDSCLKHPDGVKTDQINDLNIVFFEAPLREVLVELSMMSNIPIVVDENVDGLISVNMSGINFDDALDVVLSGGDFTYRKMARHVLVGSALPDSPIFHKLAINCHYRPQHSKPIDLAATLSPYFRQFISIHKDSDYLTITAAPNTLNLIRNHLNNIDRKPEQLLLEMQIIEVSSEAMDLLGVNWNRFARDANTKANRRMGTAEWSGIERNAAVLSNPIYSYGYLPIRTLTDSLQVLRTNGDAHIMAMPSIVTLDGKEAIFSSTSTVWLPFVNSGSNANGKELVYGINMKMVPRIADGGKVKLDIINATVSDFTTDSQGRPKITSHTISNTVYVQDGDYLVLGGLFQKKSRKRHEGIPFLKDIPLVGALFGQKKDDLIETEVLIMIRPKILGG